ncbi:MAG: ribosome small subunit-dependent GTPase [Bacteroidota bacterium]
MTARVYKSTGSWYVLKDASGQFMNARMKGRFKMDGLTSTNPIAVGDMVDVEPESGQETGWVIAGIHDRRNYVNRVSPARRKRHHIIASNLDQSLLVATLKDPRTSMGFVDRFLIACEAYHVPAIIAINKCDDFDDREEDMFLQWKAVYEPVGYQVLRVSGTTGEGMEALQGLLAGRITLFSGHSGVGKSTLINRLMPGLDLRTKEVSDWSGKGMHTTTFAEMFDLPDGGAIIDTPGVREFGLVDIEEQELAHYFPEMRARMHQCQFNNCQHVNEPGCAIKNAVMAGHISEERYISYCTILDGLDEA